MNNGSIKFGSIYWVPRKLSPYSTGYWCVVLCTDITEKKILWVKLNSGIYKIFPNFGSFTNLDCINCSKHKKLDNFKRYLLGASQYIDIDTVVFLNHLKYKNTYGFLEKETFFSVNKIDEDNLFDFSERVRLGDYKFVGSLFTNNAKSVLVSARASEKVDKKTCGMLVKSYRD